MADLTSTDVYRLIEAQHPPPAWATFCEVRGATGVHRRSRYADAMAMSLWPSRGLELHGFEIKIARNDWLRELKAPEKADELAVFCDRWWVVAPEGVVDRAELPPTWGLYEVTGSGKRRKLRAAVKAEPRDAKPLDLPFIAGLLRRAHEGTERRLKSMIDRSAIAEEIEAAREKGKADAEFDVSCELDSLRRLKEKVQRFEAESGVQIDSWGYGRIAEDVRALATIRETGEPIRSVVDAALTHAQRAVERLTAVAADLKSKEDQAA